MKIRWSKPCSWLGAIILAFGLVGILAGTARTDDAEDKLGNWMGVNSTVRFSDHWSIFGQGEARFWEPACLRPASARLRHGRQYPKA